MNLIIAVSDASPEQLLFMISGLLSMNWVLEFK